MNKQVLKQMKELRTGALIKVEWTDASIGKSLSSGLSAIDVPVTSWGIFIGVLGEKSKHIILGQNNFRYADGLYDIDYTAIPLSWAVNIHVIQEQHVPQDEAKQLLSSFVMGGRRRFPRRTKQQRIVNHEKLD
ncbi:hypothetical protein G4O51_09520 [Candidatus Bathyarchaeota archaeon A05DMB-2]|jgi:hypothetical protein|nr:hypothetical protein [Candidatus Bathyarchaeota archaeon A05DMB-2]